MHTWFHVQLDQKNFGRTLIPSSVAPICLMQTKTHRQYYITYGLNFVSLQNNKGFRLAVKRSLFNKRPVKWPCYFTVFPLHYLTSIQGPLEIWTEHYLDPISFYRFRKFHVRGGFLRP